MFEVIFENDNGKKFIFGPAGSNWFGMSVGNGLDVTLGKSQGFGQIGETVETLSVTGRPIDVTGEFYGNIVSHKNALRSACAPLSAGRLIFQKTHYIRVFVKAAPTFSAVKKNGLFKMQFYAPFPFFRDLSQRQHLIGAVVPGFQFPVNYAEPHHFGLRSSARSTNVVNDGDVRVPFDLHLRSSGISTNITVTNLRTFAFLRLRGTVSAGESVRIYRDEENVLRAELTADGVTTDILYRVDEDSTLFELEVGDNLISANDDEGGVSLTARFTFHPAVAALYET